MQQADSSDPYIDPFNVQETLRQGDSLLYVLNFSNGTGALDVTGYSFVYTAKRNRSDPDSAAVVQTFYNAIPGADSTAGRVPFEAIAEGPSSLIPPNVNYVFDIRYRTPANMTATIAEGSIFIVQPISQNVIPAGP